MFSLVPWKKRSGDVAVRRDEPLTRYPREAFPLTRFREELESLMNRFFEETRLGQQFAAAWPSLPSLPRFEWHWDMGWQDEGNEYVFRAELPGFEPDDFDVKISGNLLTVRAEHKAEQEEAGGSSYLYGSFRRTFTLPHGAREDKIEARYHSGVLELHVPKTQESLGKRIEVKST